MTRSVFYAFGAYVGSITGPTSCSWFATDPNTIAWDPKQMVSVDLSRNPQGVRNGAITAAAIQVDDSQLNGGLTRIGPLFPTGVMIGACWLDSGFWTNLATSGPYQPPRLTAQDQCRDYELTSVLDWVTNRRFCGFYAQIGATAGPTSNLALCTIWNAGTSLVPGVTPAGTWWLDSSATADPVAGGFTTVAKTGDAGALFLDAPTVQLLKLAGPKRPPYTGHRTYFVGLDEQ